MLSPSIISGTISRAPAINTSLDVASVRFCASDIRASLFIVDGLFNGHVADETLCSIPVVGGYVNIRRPKLKSVGRTDTGVMALRIPNPRNPEEMRRSIQQIKTILSRQSGSTGSVDAELSRLQSVVNGLSESVDAVVDIIGEQEALEVDETVAIGQPVYVKATSHIGLSNASALSTARVCGLATQNALATFACAFLPSGKLTLSDWTAATGSTTLTAGSDYFLSETLGLLTTSSPVTAGSCALRVGKALTTLTMKIEISLPILL
jgi:hypothetical protein